MPPDDAQAPIEIDHLGWGIWSQMRRITGASLKGSRPAQIRTSAWRGEKLIRSMPKRARSKSLAAVAMNSIAQHAVPNGIGHREFALAQLTRKSSRVATHPSCDSGAYATVRLSAGALNPIATPLSSRRIRNRQGG